MHGSKDRACKDSGCMPASLRRNYQVKKAAWGQSFPHRTWVYKGWSTSWGNGMWKIQKDDPDHGSKITGANCTRWDNKSQSWSGAFGEAGVIYGFTKWIGPVRCRCCQGDGATNSLGSAHWRDQRPHIWEWTPLSFACCSKRACCFDGPPSSSYPIKWQA